MIDEIRKNINTEIEMLREISSDTKKLQFAKDSERKLLESNLKSLKNSFKIINDSIPRLLSEVTLAKTLSVVSSGKKTELEKISYNGLGGKFEAIIPKSNREKLLKELSIREKYVRKLKRERYGAKEDFKEFKAARGYLKFSNKLFLNKAISLIKRGKFKDLSNELRKANIDVLSQTYVAMMYTTALLSLIFSVFLSVFLFFFNVHLSLPLIDSYSGEYLIRLTQIGWIPFVIPIFVFIFIYYYPSTEKSTISKRIGQELPFAVIHMSAISGSGIQPSEIFKIIGLNKEYPYLRKEIRKVLNQINLYGYDLVSALNSVSKTTSSPKLSELFSGLATTIHSGGSLPNFFEKRAETLLISYRLEREKYIKAAETFMDIYISIVIAAPMILMLLLIIMSIANFSTGLSMNQMTFVIIAVIALINVAFLTFLHITQPNY